MGGYAGGIRYESGEAGYAMVGDICLEAICEYHEPTAGSTLLQGWPPNAYARADQTGAFIHEALHGLDLPHPDGWPEDDLPGWGETLMGRWWNMPSFTGTQGLTQREVDRVLLWLRGISVEGSIAGTVETCSQNSSCARSWLISSSRMIFVAHIPRVFSKPIIPFPVGITVSLASVPLGFQGTFCYTMRTKM